MIEEPKKDTSKIRTVLLGPSGMDKLDCSVLGSTMEYFCVMSQQHFVAMATKFGICRLGKLKKLNTYIQAVLYFLTVARD